jgi:hypothetical protein
MAYAEPDPAALAQGRRRAALKKKAMRAFDQIMTMLERGMAVAPAQRKKERR